MSHLSPFNNKHIKPDIGTHTEKHHIFFNMSTLLLSLFDIPHIAEAITDSLSFTDLLSCILVNQTWYDDLIGVLWLDVISYRSTTFKN